MARVTGKLTALKVQRLLEPGMHADGNGLYLQVTAAGARTWIYRFTLGGRAREMGIGSLSSLGLADARDKATECRKLRSEGIDPIEARKKEKTDSEIAAAKSVTFNTAADAFIASHKAGWRNAKHADQWVATLKTYAYPHFGTLPVGSIDTTLVLKALEPIWATKPETATRLRGRIESILDWATVRGYRAGENPARWRGHLDKLLPRRSKVRAVKHHAALPDPEVAAFLVTLRGMDGIAARALEFAILTAARSGEVLGAAWSEVDEAQAIWTVPAARMKAGKEHKVPLCRRALEIIAAMKAMAHSPFVFPGFRPGKPLSNMALDMTLRRMKVEITTHGFRSSFRDWAAERSSFPAEVVEMALAHAVGSKVEAAYRRGDLFDKRRKLMDAWAGYVGSPSTGSKVVPLSSRQSA